MPVADLGGDDPAQPAGQFVGHDLGPEHRGPVGSGEFGHGKRRQDGGLAEMAAVVEIVKLQGVGEHDVIVESVPERGRTAVRDDRAGTGA